MQFRAVPPRTGRTPAAWVATEAATSAGRVLHQVVSGAETVPSGAVASEAAALGVAVVPQTQLSCQQAPAATPEAGAEVEARVERSVRFQQKWREMPCVTALSSSNILVETSRKPM